MFVCGKVKVSLVVWGQALWCWKILPLFCNGTMCGCSISSQYRWAVKLPFTCTRSVVPVWEIAADIWHFRLRYVDFLNAISRKSLCRRLSTLAGPFERCNNNLDSSMNQTVFKRCCGQTLSVRDYGSLFWRCCRFKTTALTGRLARLPASRSRFLTVWSEVLHPTGMNEGVEIAVLNRSRKCCYLR